MERSPALGNLKAALGAGALAGMALAIFHFMATEPVLEEAIRLEEALPHLHMEVFPRSVQRLGLFGGSFIYGLSWGLIFAGVYTLLESQLPGRRPWQKGAVLALAALWAVALLPLLKFPPNPPGGTGSEDTVTTRQVRFALFALASALALFGIWRIVGFLKLIPFWARGMAFVTLYALACCLLVFLVPNANDPIPGQLKELVPRFRILAVGGTILFWLLLGGAFGPFHIAFAKPEATARRGASGPR